MNWYCVAGGFIGGIIFTLFVIFFINRMVASLKNWVVRNEKRMPVKGPLTLTIKN